MSDKYIYAVEHPDGFFKIGRSADPYSRKSQIQTGCPRELVLKYVLSANNSMFRPNVESEIHGRLEEYNHRGEWFCVDSSTVLWLFHEMVQSDEQEGYWITNIPRERSRMPEWKQNLDRRVDL